MYIGSMGPCAVLLFFLRTFARNFLQLTFFTNFSHNQIIKIEDDLLSFGDRTHVKIVRF